MPFLFLNSWTQYSHCITHHLPLDGFPLKIFNTEQGLHSREEKRILGSATEFFRITSMVNYWKMSLGVYKFQSRYKSLSWSPTLFRPSNVLKQMTNSTHSCAGNLGLGEDQDIPEWDLDVCQDVTKICSRSRFTHNPRSLGLTLYNVKHLMC